MTLRFKSIDRLPEIGDIIYFGDPSEGTPRRAEVVHMKEVAEINPSIGLTQSDIKEPYIDHVIRGFIYKTVDGVVEGADICIMRFHDGYNNNVWFEDHEGGEGVSVLSKKRVTNRNLVPFNRFPVRLLPESIRRGESSHEAVCRGYRIADEEYAAILDDLYDKADDLCEQNGITATMSVEKVIEEECWEVFPAHRRIIASMLAGEHDHEYD